MKTLKECLTEWRDIDGAQDSLARCLGLMGPETRFHIEAKHVYWSRDHIGATLFDIMKSLADVGVLEWSEEDDFRVRWNPNFRGSWER